MLQQNDERWAKEAHVTPLRGKSRANHSDGDETVSKIRTAAGLTEDQAFTAPYQTQAYPL
jgi:hypothetical protein